MSVNPRKDAQRAGLLYVRKPNPLPPPNQQQAPAAQATPVSGGGSLQPQTQPNPTLQQTQPNPTSQAFQDAQRTDPANQVPTPQNTPVIPDAPKALAKMTDAELAQLVRDSQKASLPNHLADRKDATQQFVYTAGVNEKPTVLDAADYNRFLRDNNISPSDQLSRSFNTGSYTSGNVNYNITPQMIANMYMYSSLQYVGGKQGGQAYGAGTYFDRNGGRNTGYGGTTIVGVLDPKRARPITDAALARRAAAFARTHPQFNRAVGGYNTSYSGGKNNQAIWALVMGYNVITDGVRSYHNVLDRSVMVIKK